MNIIYGTISATPRYTRFVVDISENKVIVTPVINAPTAVSRSTL